MTEHFLPVTRTARYYVLGDESAAPDEIWFVLHGYGQLAARFARSFAPLAEAPGARRLVVAPEALSRFYVDAPAAASHAGAKVGATWMTREDREHEIADYVAYLDALAERVLAGAAVPGDGLAAAARPRIHVLGFSQGVATAARWVARGRVRAHRLTLWGGTLPADVGAAGDAAWAERLRSLAGGITLVGGARDALAAPASLGEQERRLRDLGVPCDLRTFDGGHEIHAPTLAALAAAAAER